MDDRRFDAAVRALQAGTTRRSGLAAGLAALLGGGFLDAAAKHKDRHRGSGRDGHDNAHMEGPCGDGSGPDNRCESNQECCTRYCDLEIRRCRCKRAGFNCTSDRNCCGSLTCEDGGCWRKVPPSPPCNGCIDDGVCQPGNTPEFCGKRGEICSVILPPGLCCGGEGSAPAYGYQSGFGTAGTGSQQFSNPRAIAITADGLTAFVVDAVNNRVQIWTRTSKTSSQWTWQQDLGSLGSGTGQFNSPYAIAVNADGTKAWIGDSGNQRVVEWARSAGQWAQAAVIATGFRGINGIAVDSTESIMSVTEQASSSVVTLAKSNGSWVYLSQSGSNGSGDGQFANPIGGVAYLGDGAYMVVADTGNRRISVWRFNSSRYRYEFVMNSTGGTSPFVSPKAVAIADFSYIAMVYVTDGQDSVWTGLFVGDGFEFNQRMTDATNLVNPMGVAVNPTADVVAVTTIGGTPATFWTPRCP